MCRQRTEVADEVLEAAEDAVGDAAEPAVATADHRHERAEGLQNRDYAPR